MLELWHRLIIAYSRALFWLRSHNPLGASWAVVNEDTTVDGVVTEIQGTQLDGDWTFNVAPIVILTQTFTPRPDDLQYHCEVMPAERWVGPKLDALCKSLRVGDRVRVRGREVYDTKHAGYQQELEIHPVKGLERC